eukprot:g34202.t1
MANCETYLNSLALKHMPPNLQALDLLKAVPKPNLDSFVFLRVKEKQENILVEPETEDQRPGCILVNLLSNPFFQQCRGQYCTQSSSCGLSNIMYSSMVRMKILFWDRVISYCCPEGVLVLISWIVSVSVKRWKLKSMDRSFAVLEQSSSYNRSCGKVRSDGFEMLRVAGGYFEI